MNFTNEKLNDTNTFNLEGLFQLFNEEDATDIINFTLKHGHLPKQAITLKQTKNEQKLFKNEHQDYNNFKKDYDNWQGFNNEQLINLHSKLIDEHRVGKKILKQKRSWTKQKNLTAKIKYQEITKQVENKHNSIKGWKLKAKRLSTTPKKLEPKQNEITEEEVKEHLLNVNRMPFDDNNTYEDNKYYRWICKNRIIYNNETKQNVNNFEFVKIKFGIELPRFKRSVKDVTKDFKSMNIKNE